MTKASSTSASSSSMATSVSTIKAYSVPLALFLVAMFYQVVLIPKSFPPSHYDALLINKYSSIEEVKEAYEKLSSKWNSAVEVSLTSDFIKIRYAYELLTNPTWKKNYDIFGIEEQLDVLEKAKEQYAGKSISTVDLPLLDSAIPDTGDDSLNVITSEGFQSIIQDSRPLLIQLFSFGSKSSFQFSDAWKRIAVLLDGVATTASVELGNLHLVAYLSEKKATGRPFFRNGFPSLVAFPEGCRTADCLSRYDGELSVDAVTEWFTTNIVGLPRIFYYSKETLGQNFLAKVSPHKVKVIIFSRTGERAVPVVRQAAKKYWSHASFAFVLWREEESSVWFNAFEVESAPAIVFLKDPGAKPVVHHGAVNNTWFSTIMEQNKMLELPQLRSETSIELGCDARDHSRAGYDTSTWYCAILAGRHGPELNKMRETIRRVQELLSSDIESSEDQTTAPALGAIRSKRLTFTWLEGETQKRYCFFYLNSENSYDTCGPRRDLADVPQLFIVRYKRNASEEDTKPKRKKGSIWDSLQEQELDPASQLVAKYNGSDETSEIIKWVSQIIKDGDSRDLPHYRTKTPELVPDDAQPIWSKGVQSLPSTSRIKQHIRGFITKIYDLIQDPRIGPILLLAALISFGTIWLQRSQPPQQPNQQDSNQPSQPNAKFQEKRKARRRERVRTASNERPSPSITDEEPKNAYQMPFSDSDSE
uniref:J domain-containing protein n=1 Tax=Cannabis sativa TaxID=3483 RepID=A0A803R088_CANSA